MSSKTATFVATHPAKPSWVTGHNVSVCIDPSGDVNQVWVVNGNDDKFDDQDAAVVGMEAGQARELARLVLEALEGGEG